LSASSVSCQVVSWLFLVPIAPRLRLGLYRKGVPTCLSAFWITLVDRILWPISLLPSLKSREVASCLPLLLTRIAFSCIEPILAPAPPRAQIAFGPPMMPDDRTRFSPARVMRAIASVSRSLRPRSRSIAALKSMLSVPR